MIQQKNIHQKELEKTKPLQQITLNFILLCNVFSRIMNHNLQRDK